MSIRAYRVNSIETKTEESFNFWHNENIVSFLGDKSDCYKALNDDRVGMFEVAVEVLKEAVIKADELQLSNRIVSNLQDDIAWAECNNTDYVRYYCY